MHQNVIFYYLAMGNCLSKDKNKNISCNRDLFNDATEPGLQLYLNSTSVRVSILDFILHMDLRAGCYLHFQGYVNN